MFGFLLGVAFGAAGYWAWNSFGRDLLGMGDQGETTYGSFNTSPSVSTTPPTSFSTPTSPSSGSTSGGTSNSDATSSTGSIGTTPTGGE
jgi:hypothetical protein